MTYASVRALLGIEANTVPEFGFKPRTPLKGNRHDNTEIDMRGGAQVHESIAIGAISIHGKLPREVLMEAWAGHSDRHRRRTEIYLESLRGFTTQLRQTSGEEAYEGWSALTVSHHDLRPFDALSHPHTSARRRENGHAHQRTSWSLVLTF
jgi:hypothetical protein